jgi:hypothetical protein
MVCAVVNAGASETTHFTRYTHFMALLSCKYRTVMQACARKSFLFLVLMLNKQRACRCEARSPRSRAVCGLASQISAITPVPPWASLGAPADYKVLGGPSAALHNVTNKLTMI